MGDLALLGAIRHYKHAAISLYDAVFGVEAAFSAALVVGLEA